jgi:hypothetical protein
MSEYQPGNQDRGTCPACDRRCKVRKVGNVRVCCWHRSPQRDITFAHAPARCYGTGEVCREDREGPNP